CTRMSRRTVSWDGCVSVALPCGLSNTSWTLGTPVGMSTVTRRARMAWMASGTCERCWGARSRASTLSSSVGSSWSVIHHPGRQSGSSTVSGVVAPGALDDGSPVIRCLLNECTYARLAGQFLWRSSGLQCESGESAQNHRLPILLRYRTVKYVIDTIRLPGRSERNRLGLAPIG